jgi:steroid 5-alpha reductase family enzyme
MFDLPAFLLALAALLALTTAVWALSLRNDDVSIIDPAWPLLFLVAAGVYAWSAEGPELSTRAWLVLATVGLWTLRLGGYLTWRKSGEPEDRRYTAMREGRPKFRISSLWIVFWLQAALAWIISLPLLPAVWSTAPLGWLDALGLALFATGFLFESLGDLQLARFKARPDTGDQVLDTGLWRYTRHPNYFGNFCMWWGWFTLALATGAWWSAIGPALMSFMLLKVSGVSLLEGDIEERRPKYKDYMNRTNAFFPGPPRGV